MKRHTRIFFKYWGYGDQHLPDCWVCYKPAVDIHHLISKKMGGVKNNRLNRIDNLFPVCRSCHTIAHQHKDINEEWKIHLKQKIDNKEYEENNG